MNNIVVKTYVWKSGLALFCCLLFVLTGIFIISVSENWIETLIGVTSITFFGAGFFILLRQIIDRRPRISIDETGITDRTLGVGKIDWADVEFVHLNSTFANNFLVLKLSNTEKYLQNLSNTSRKLTKLNKNRLRRTKSQSHIDRYESEKTSQTHFSESFRRSIRFAEDGTGNSKLNYSGTNSSSESAVCAERSIAASVAFCSSLPTEVITRIIAPSVLWRKMLSQTVLILS